jgi:hypothetical protein
MPPISVAAEGPDQTDEPNQSGPTEQHVQKNDRHPVAVPPCDRDDARHEIGRKRDEPDDERDREADEGAKGIWIVVHGRVIIAKPAPRINYRVMVPVMAKVEVTTTLSSGGAL